MGGPINIRVYTTSQVNAEGETERKDVVTVRDDFWVLTSDRQLNFVQHTKTLLAINGRAAVVVPDGSAL